jgi:hypothetical protein
MATLYEVLFLKALGATVLSETIVLAVLYARFCPKPVPWLRLALAGIWASAGSLPYLWFVLPSVITNRIIFMIAGEVFVTLIEVPVLCYFLALTWKRAALFSVICNCASIGVGLLFFR